MNRIKLFQNVFGVCKEDYRYEMVLYYLKRMRVFQ